MANTERIPERKDVGEEFKWRLEDIYPTNSDWEADYERAKSYIEKAADFKGKISQSAKSLLDYLTMDDEISVLLDGLANYAHRRCDEDTRNAVYQAMKGKLEPLFVEMSSAAAFARPEIISIPEDKMEYFYREEKGLELYRVALTRLREMNEHILSDSEERLLAMTGEISESPDNIFSMFNDADLTFPDIEDGEGNKIQVTHGSYIPLMHNPDRSIRKAAFESMYHTYEHFRNTSAAMLSAQVKTVGFYAKARNYPSALDASLAANRVPTEVYHSLIDAVHDNMHYMYDYVRLRKKLLGVDELHMYDLYVPIVGDCDIPVTFEEAKKTVAEALSVMGEDYVKILTEGFESGWIDVYENVGKTSGAYSAGARVHPFVLLNHKDNLESEFTLAHEMGHAIHSYLSNKCQPVVYSQYVIFVAEVASTCNEVLLLMHLYKKTFETGDLRQRAYIINYFLEQVRTTLYRQTMFAEFELKINEMSEKGETLTADALCALYRDLNKLYFGDDVVIDSEIDMEWARIPHFYYNFYVFQYATGFSAAVALADRILNEGEPAVKDYLRFLSGGCSKDPIDLLKTAGVDMTSPEPVNDALRLFKKMLDEMEHCMEK